LETSPRWRKPAKRFASVEIETGEGQESAEQFVTPSDLLAELAHAQGETLDFR